MAASCLLPRTRGLVDEEEAALHAAEDAEDENTATVTAATDDAVCAHLEALVGFAEAELVAAREDPEAAARRSLLHGPLLALRYMVGELDWEGAPLRARAARVGALLHRAVDAAGAAAELARDAVNASTISFEAIGAEDADSGAMDVDAALEAAALGGGQAGDASLVPAPTGAAAAPSAPNSRAGQTILASAPQVMMVA